MKGASSHQERLLRHTPEFSLVLGGPIFQLLRRSHLTDNALDLVAYRIVVISLLCWLPLFALSLGEGKILSGTAVPFLLDFDVHVRFLIVVPLLVAAELVVHRRMRFLVAHFFERQLIPEVETKKFESALDKLFRLRNSVAAEVALLIFVYLVGVLIIWRQYFALNASTWYATPVAGSSELTLSGMWFGYVSLPIFQFLLCRWYFRLFIWVRFLWHLSRIEMSLVPIHPDRVAGLGFLSEIVYAFIPLLLAHGALLGGHLANRIYYLGATLPQFMIEILVFVLFLMTWVLGPLLVFVPQLAKAKRSGMREYGLLAERYVREFETKWVRRDVDHHHLIGSADIQSLADLGNSFDIVRTMRVVPFNKETIMHLALAAVVPIGPLVLTIMPLEDLLKKLLGILF